MQKNVKFSFEVTSGEKFFVIHKRMKNRRKKELVAINQTTKKEYPFSNFRNINIMKETINPDYEADPR